MSQNFERPPLPHHLEDQNYQNYEDISFTVDQHYSGDIGWLSTAEHIIDSITIKKNTTEKLKERNILINQSKTEKHKIQKRWQ